MNDAIFPEKEPEALLQGEDQLGLKGSFSGCLDQAPPMLQTGEWGVDRANKNVLRAISAPGVSDLMWDLG